MVMGCVLNCLGLTYFTCKLRMLAEQKGVKRVGCGIGYLWEGIFCLVKGRGVSECVLQKLGGSFLHTEWAGKTSHRVPGTPHCVVREEELKCGQLCPNREGLTKLSGLLSSETGRGEHLNISHIPADRARERTEGGPRMWGSLSLGWRVQQHGWCGESGWPGTIKAVHGSAQVSGRCVPISD